MLNSQSVIKVCRKLMWTFAQAQKTVMNVLLLPPTRKFQVKVDFFQHPHSSQWIIVRCLLTQPITTRELQGSDLVQGSAKSDISLHSIHSYNYRNVRVSLLQYVVTCQTSSVLVDDAFIQLSCHLQQVQTVCLALVSREYWLGLNIHFICNNSKIALRRQNEARRQLSQVRCDGQS